MQVKHLISDDTQDVEIFCQKCKLAGYKNNQSLRDLKWGDVYDLPSQPEYWAVYQDDQIVSIAGCHKFQENSNTLRCLFRAATVPTFKNTVKGLSKTHINSLSKYILPKQIVYGLENNYTDFVITTNKENDSSGKMLKTHRVYEYMAANKVVEYLGDIEYLHTMQSVWKINVGRYLDQAKCNLPLS